MFSIGYKQLQVDNAIFLCSDNTSTCIITIHVDNYLSFSNTSEMLANARKELHLTFKMKAIDPNWIMGFHLIDDKDSGRVAISHWQYLKMTVKRYRLSDANPISTLIEPGLKLSKDDSPQTPIETEDMRRTPYREVISSALWTSLVYTPQISYTVCQASRFGQNPSRTH
jgi:hypothetical protein